MRRFLEQACVALLCIIAFSLPFDFSLRTISLEIPLIKTLLILEVVILLFLWELVIFAEKKVVFKEMHLFIPFFLFLGLHVFSAVFPSEKMIWSLKYTLRFFSIGMIAFAIPRFAVTARQLNRIVRSLFLGAACAAVMVLIQYRWPYLVVNLQRFFDDAVVNPSRVRGLFGWPTNMSVYFGTLIPLTMAHLFYKPKQYKAEKILYGIFIVILLICPILSKSRGWIIGLFCGCSTLWIIYVISQKDYKILTAGLLLLIVLASLTANVLFNFPGILKNELEHSEASRVTMARCALSTIKEYPLRGIGADMFYWRMNPYTRTHNIFLETAVNVGIFGVFILVWLLGTIFWKIGKRVFKTPVLKRSYLSIGVFSSLISFLGHNQVDYFWDLHEIIGLFWILVGIGLAAAGLKSDT